MSNTGAGNDHEFDHIFNKAAGSNSELDMSNLESSRAMIDTASITHFIFYLKLAGDNEEYITGDNQRILHGG